jgi:hypothetical protein
MEAENYSTIENLDQLKSILQEMQIGAVLNKVDFSKPISQYQNDFESYFTNCLLLKDYEFNNEIINKAFMVSIFLEQREEDSYWHMSIFEILLDGYKLADKNISDYIFNSVFGDVKHNVQYLQSQFCTVRDYYFIKQP